MNIFIFVLAVVILFSLMCSRINEIQLRIELSFALMGVNYRPGKTVCFAASVAFFFLLHTFMFNR